MDQLPKTKEEIKARIAVLEGKRDARKAAAKKEARGKKIQGVKKAFGKGITVVKDAVNMMGEGHARSMNPEGGRPYEILQPELLAELTKKLDILYNKRLDWIDTHPDYRDNEDEKKEEDLMWDEIDAMKKEREKLETNTAKDTKKGEPSISDQPKKKGWLEKHRAKKEMKRVEQEAYEEEGERQKETIPTPDEEVEIKKELDELPEEKKVEVAIGLNNIGFKVEQKKNEFFAKTLGWLQKTSLNEKNTVNRFLGKLQESFARDAKAAKHKAENPSSFIDSKIGLNIKGKKRGLTISGGVQQKMGNMGSLVGNIAKYGRMISDFTTHSLASPLRYVIMGGMALSRGADAAKEARLDNEEVKDKTRIADEEKAAEEAWQIYRNAMENDPDQEMSAERLQQAYMEKMPKDLMERLSREPGEATNLIQKVIKGDLGGAIERLNKQIEEIESNSKFTLEEKRNQTQILLKNQERNLLDYDRILTQYGTVDGFAMAGRYAKAAGNAVVWATTVETIALSVEKLWGNLAHMLSHEDSHKAAGAIAKVATHKPIHAINADTTSHAIKPDTTHLAQQADTTAHVDSTHVNSDSTKVVSDTTKVAGIKSDTVLKTTLETKGDSLKISSDSTKIIGDTTHTTMGADSTAAAAVASVGKKGAEAVAGAGEKTANTAELHSGFSLDKPTEFEVRGPGELEHSYEKLLLSHHLPQEDLSSKTLVIDKILATRTLNEAANMVRLTEGHGAAGITADDFAKVANFKGGVLHIIDAKGFNEIMDKLHTHSEELVGKGIFNDPDSATGYIKHVNWTDKVEGNGMHGSVEHPGITGHPEVRENQIEDFKNIPDPHEHAIDTARQKLFDLHQKIELAETGMGRPPESLMNPELKLPGTAPIVDDNVLDSNNPMFQEHMTGAMEGKPVIDATYNPYEDMTRVWSPEDAKIAYENTIQHLYPQDHGYVYNGNWLIAKDTPALEIFNANVPPDDIVYGPVADQMHRIEEVTGLVPKGETWFRSAETVAKFIMRGTQKAAEMGTEAMQKLRVTE